MMVISRTGNLQALHFCIADRRAGCRIGGVKNKTNASKELLSAEEIQIGSWWEIAQGSYYGYCVTGVDVKRKEATVLGTDGEVRKIDTAKLQYRYSRVLPNGATRNHKH
jgi:hypothetical protein